MSSGLSIVIWTMNKVENDKHACDKGRHNTNRDRGIDAVRILLCLERSCVSFVCILILF